MVVVKKKWNSKLKIIVMKKYLKLAFIAAVAAAFCGCEESEGTDPGSDAAPVVTIYTNNVPDGYSSDNTVSLRVCPNNMVEKMYVYTELKDDKDAYIASNGGAAYIARVVENGTEYEGEDTDLVITDLEGIYATTVVAEDAGGSRVAYENIFKGVVWVEAGRSYIYQNFVHDGVMYLSGYVTVQRQSDSNIFRVNDLFCQLDPTLSRIPSTLTFSFDAERKFTGFTSSEAPFVIVNFPDGDMLLHGYYDPVTYSSYCYTDQNSDAEGNYVLVVMLGLDNNTGNLYTNKYIYFYTDELEWYK